MFEREDDWELFSREEERMRILRQREVEEDEFDEVAEEWMRREQEFYVNGGEA